MDSQALLVDIRKAGIVSQTTAGVKKTRIDLLKRYEFNAGMGRQGHCQFQAVAADAPEGRERAQNGDRGVFRNGHELSSNLNFSSMLKTLSHKLQVKSTASDPISAQRRNR
jgi:hypothetical protein